MRDYIVKTWLAALIALMPCVADAAGLGRLTILSALGEPLNAEIDLVAVSRDELGTLNASLASPDAYRQANLQYSAALPGARLSVEKRPNGQPYIKITTHRPVNEPFIDLLVELTWSSGRLVREYTALLDPPGMAPAPAPPPVAVAPETRPVPVAPAPVAVAPMPERVAPTRPITGAKEYGPIQRGETLGRIARSVMPEGVTLEQMLVALYRSNPEVFIRKNLNLIRTGKILRIPEREELAAVDRREAVKEYRAHVADWNAYRQRLADAAGVTSAEGRSAVTGRITTRVDDKAAGEPRDVVRLSKGEPPGPAGAAKPRPASERIRVLEEEVVAREKALAEANDRIAQLEKTIKDMQKLLELKGPGLAAAQQAAKPKPEVAAMAKPDAAKPAPKPEAAPAPKPEAQPVEPPKPVQAAAPEQPAPKPKPKAAPMPPPPPPEPDLLQQVLDEPLYLAAGGGVIVLGGLMFWMVRRRRAQGGDDIVSRAAPTLGAAAAGAGAVAATSAAPAELARPPAAAAAASDEVDPLAEAEVYIAYGRDGQAEEILKEALAKDRTRQDVQLKLLEIYSARKDKNAFGRFAGEMQKLTGGSGENWLKVAAMGYALDPGNSLYAAGKGVAAAAPAAAGTGSDLDFDLGAAAVGVTSTDIALEAGTVEEPPTRTLDPRKPEGVAARAEKADEAPAGPLMPDFTLEIPSAGETPTKTEVTRVEPSTENRNVIDFNLDAPKTDTTGGQPATERKAESGGVDFKLDLPDINLEIDNAATTQVRPAGAQKDGHWYDVQTKFDLAKAYQEMGDKDGAKEILQEVMKEGDAEQKAQAKALLQSLG